MINALLASVSSYALLAASSGGGDGGNLPVDLAHRYWRLHIIGWGGQQYNGLSGIQLYAGGVNVAPGATLTATNMSGQNVNIQAGSLASVLNYVAGTSHVQFDINGGFEMTFNLDLGSAKKVSEVGIYPNKDLASRTPIAFWLEWSDDGVAYTKLAWMRRTTEMTIGQEVRYIVPAAKENASDWAIWGWNPTGSIGELQMLNPSGVDLTTGQTAYASSRYSSTEDAPQAIDDNNNTNWSGGSDNNIVTLGVRFATPVQPVKVGIQSRNDSQYWNKTPWQNVFFGYSEDGQTYRLKKELTEDNEANPYSGPVQNVIYDVPQWTSAPGPNAHRYWRIKGTSVRSGDNAQYSEIEFRRVAGGPNLATGGEALASAEYSLPTWAKENAFDGDPNTNWAGQGVIGQWIGYDFKKKVEVREVAMRASSLADQGWGTMNLEYSDDGVNWGIFAYLFSTPKIDNWRTYALNVTNASPDAGYLSPHRYWRVETLQYAGFQGMSEVIFMDGGVDLVTKGGTPSVDAFQSGYPVTNLFDRNVSTGWADNADNLNHQIQWDFGSGNAQKMTKYKIGGWPGGGITPTGWRVQFSDDGVVWKLADMRLGEAAFGSSEVREYKFKADPAAPDVLEYPTFRYFRVAPMGATSGYQRVREFALYAEVGDASKLAATVTASSTTGTPSEVPGSAVDGDTATEWVCASSDTAPWLQLDLGEAKTVKEFGLYAPMDNPHVWGSNDGTNWTQLTPTDYYIKARAFISRYGLCNRLFRLKAIYSESWIDIAELNFYKQDGAALTLVADHIAPNQWQSNTPGSGEYWKNMKDGNAATYGTFQAPSSIDSPRTWTFPLYGGDPVTMGMIATSRQFKDWMLDVSYDYGKTFETRIHRSAQNWNQGTEKKIDISKPKAGVIPTYDQLGLGAPKGVWSLRRAVAGYSGPIVRVIINSVETDLFAQDDGWIKFSGNPLVVKLYDQSGNGNHLTPYNIETNTNYAPRLIGGATPSRRPVIYFEQRKNLRDPNPLTAKAYLTTMPIAFVMAKQYYGGAYPRYWNIPQAYGSDSSPYMRFGMQGNGSTYADGEVRVNGNARAVPGNKIMGGYSGSWHAETFWAKAGWIDFVGWRERGATIPSSIVEYPNPTGLVINANGSFTDIQGSIQQYFSEIAFFDGDPAVEVRNAALDIFDRMTAHVMFGDGRLLRIDSDAGADGGTGSGIGELEFYSELGSPGFDITDNYQFATGLNRYNSSETWAYAFDNNINTLWSGNSNPNLNVITDMDGEIVGGKFTARNDIYYTGATGKMTVNQLRFDGWDKPLGQITGLSAAKGAAVSFGEGGPPVDLSWTTIFTATPAAESGSWGTYTLRGRVATSTFSDRTKRYLRLKFKSGAGGMIISKATLGIGNNSDYSLNAAPQVVTFGGGNPGITVAPNTEFYTDPIDMQGKDYSSGKRLQFSAYHDDIATTYAYAVASDNQRAITAFATGDKVTQTAATGFSDISNQRSAILGVEAKDAL